MPIIVNVLLLSEVCSKPSKPYESLYIKELKSSWYFGTDHLETRTINISVVDVSSVAAVIDALEYL